MLASSVGGAGEVGAERPGSVGSGCLHRPSGNSACRARTPLVERKSRSGRAQRGCGVAMGQQSCIRDGEAQDSGLLLGSLGENFASSAGLRSSRLQKIRFSGGVRRGLGFLVGGGVRGVFVWAVGGVPFLIDQKGDGKSRRSVRGLAEGCVCFAGRIETRTPDGGRGRSDNDSSGLLCSLRLPGAKPPKDRRDTTDIPTAWLNASDNIAKPTPNG